MSELIRRRVALAVPHGLAFLERVIHGVAEYAKHNALWSFIRVPETLGTSIEWLSHWKGDGAFALLVVPEDAKKASRLSYPVVNLASHLVDSIVPSVTVDHYAIGQLAAQHLLERNFHRFGFYGTSHLYYSQLRRDGFRDVVERAGGKCELLELQSPDPGRPKLDDQHRALEQWLLSLRTPVGILASTDLRASMVLEACQSVGLRVPDDVAVIGVDNDSVVCDFCNPPLTSVARNDSRVGFEAAKVLDHLMSGGEPPEKPIRIPPTGLVPRRSTDTIAVDDPYVAEAVRFMQSHISEHFGVEQLLKAVPLSRRSLEYRFRASLGRSPYDYLNQVRVDHAKRMLADPQRASLTEIATACGFGDLRRFRIVFQRLVAASPAEYRRTALRHANGDAIRTTTATATAECFACPSPSPRTNGRRVHAGRAQC